MIVEHQLLVAKGEVRRRQEWAAEERLARQARREEREQAAEPAAEPIELRGAFGWLRRLAGAR